MGPVLGTRGRDQIYVSCNCHIETKYVLKGIEKFAVFVNIFVDSSYLFVMVSVIYNF